MRHAESAYVRLREEILDGVLAPGVPLPETSVATRLGISRTPVREAISWLARENLATVVPGKGAFVAHISLADVRELFQMRLILEPSAARLAAEQPDGAKLSALLKKFETAPELIDAGNTTAYRKLCAEMDLAISQMTHNQRLQAMLRSIWQEARRLRSATQTDHIRLRASAGEHREILCHIRDGAADAAAVAVTHHLEQCANSTIQALTLNAALFRDAPAAANGTPEGVALGMS